MAAQQPAQELQKDRYAPDSFQQIETNGAVVALFFCVCRADWKTPEGIRLRNGTALEGTQQVPQRLLKKAGRFLLFRPPDEESGGFFVGTGGYARTNL
jgi:hypothetical protein